MNLVPISVQLYRMLVGTDFSVFATPIPNLETQPEPEPEPEPELH